LFPPLHAAGELRDIMGVVFNSTAQADRVDPDDTYADDPSAMLVSVSCCLLKPGCVICLVHRCMAFVRVTFRTQARGRCMRARLCFILYTSES
jgi:hypothetical protein